MSRSHDRETRQAEEGLRALEAFWQARPPAAFRRLYTHFPHPFLAPCEFFALDAIVQGEGREFGILPQYLPFGKAVGEGGTYGFYLTPDTTQGHWPVLYRDEDEMYYRPVSSDFEAFLRHCILIGRYEMEEAYPDEPEDQQDTEERRELGRLLSLPENLLLGPVPGNDTELHERLVGNDPQDAVSLCHIGCYRRMRGDTERALDFFHRASEATPWFGDPAYMVADIYLERDNIARAVQSWWTVTRCLLPLCTRTYDWNLGEDHPEADIYEVAADGIRQFANKADDTLKTSPLWKVLVHDEPYDPSARESLGHEFLQRGELLYAEQEFLNALSLCCAEENGQPDRIYETLITLYERTGRIRDAALARHDRRLPRPTV